MYYLRTFGGLRLEHDGAAMTGAALQRSRLGLLAVLAAAGDRGMSRETLLAILWPDKDQASARGALKQAMYALRRDLGAPGLFLGEAQLGLNPEVISTDIGRYYEALARGDLEQAVTLCDSVFLDGVHLPGGEFDRWLDAQRDRATARRREALEQLATAAERRGAFGDGVRWWRMLATEDPLSARVACGLMLALARAGDRSAALEHGALHERLTQAELGTPADASVRKLTEALRRGTAGTAPGQGDIAPLLSPSQPAPRAADPAIVPSVPRRKVERPWLWGGILSVTVMSAVLAGTLTAKHKFDRDLVTMTAHGLSDRQVIQLAAALGARDRSLRVATTPAGARWMVAVGMAESPDSVRLTAQLSDRASGHPLEILEVALAEGSTPDEGLGLLADRVAIALAARRNPAFSSWGPLAALPRSWQSFQQLDQGIRAFAAEEESAIEQFRSSAVLDSTSATPVVWQAYATSYAGRRDEASALVDSLERSSRRFGPWDIAMSAFIRAGRRGDEAHDAGHELLRIVPGSEWALPVAIRLLEAGRVVEAADVLRASSLRGGWTENWQFGLAIRDAVLHTLGDYQAELRTAEEALRLFPDSRLHQQSQLKALAALGRAAEVEQGCELAMSRRPFSDGVGGWDWEPCEQAFMELRAHGNPAAARRLAERLLAWRRETVSLSAETQAQDRLRILEDLGDWVAAEALLDSPAGSGIKEAEALRIRGLIFASKGDSARALEATNHYEALAGLAGRPTPESTFERAQIPALLGDREGAVALLSAAFGRGFGGRRLVHIYPAFDHLMGYPPFEAAVHPPEDRAHLAAWPEASTIR